MLNFISTFFERHLRCNLQVINTIITLVNVYKPPTSTCGVTWNTEISHLQDNTVTTMVTVKLKQQNNTSQQSA